MTTISANGGAERYWRAADGRRMVLCRTGRFLIKDIGQRWREARFDIELDREADGRWIAEIPALPGVLVYGATEAEARTKVIILGLENDKRWRIDTGARASASVTRTQRMSRRGG